MAVSSRQSGSKSIAPASPTINKQTQKKKKNKNKRNDLTLQNEPNVDPQETSPHKRKRCPGVRVVGGRIYDSQNGKTCHQCRQKTLDFVAACKNVNQKPCTIKFCHKCLLNRYGEKAEEVAVLDDWNCPKCRGVCNCSFCMKKKGQKPTGILAHTAKATGFSSVLELLHVKGFEAVEAEKIANDLLSLPNASAACSKELVHSKQKHGKKKSFAEQGDINLQFKMRKDLLALPNKSVVSGKGLVPSKRKHAKENSSHELQHDSEKLGSKYQKKLRRDDTFSDACEGRANGGSQKKKDLQTKVSPDISLNTIKREEKVTGLDHLLAAAAADEMKVVDAETNDSAAAKPMLIPKLCKQVKPHRKSHCKDTSADIKLDQGTDLTYTDDAKSNVKTEAKPTMIPKLCKHEKKNSKSHSENSFTEVKLPQGSNLILVGGVQLSADDVGPALQFLEFCSSFGQVLDLKKGQPESVLREITCRRGRSKGYASTMEFHIKLMSIIQKDFGEESPISHSTRSRNSWFQALEKCIPESNCAWKQLALDCFDWGADGYNRLDSSKKLRLLNFLCDETLCTEDLRSWIDEENSKHVERKKQAKEKIQAAKEKEKNMKQKLKDEVAQVLLSTRDGVPLSVSDHANLVSKIRSETEKAQAEKLEAIDDMAMKKQRSDAVRTESILLDGNGQVYWKFKSYSGSHLMLQEVENWDSVTAHDRWFIYDDEQEKSIQKYMEYVSSLRKKAQKKHVLSDVTSLLSSEASIKHGSPSKSSPQKNDILEIAEGADR